MIDTPDLLAHLAVDGLLHRLARLHEPGDAAVHRHRERAAASEQRLAVALDERDHRRRQAGKASRPHDGQRRARSPGIGSVAVPQRPQNRVVRSQSTSCTARPASVQRRSSTRPYRPISGTRPSRRLHDDVGDAVAVEVDRPAGGAVERAEHVARRLGGDVVGVLVEHHAPAPPHDDRDRARPVVGQLEHRHEAAASVM